LKDSKSVEDYVTLRWLLIAICICFFTSCSPTENVRNSFDDTWRLIAGGPSGVVAFSMPAGGVLDPSVWSPNSTLSHPIDFIKEYRDMLFVMCNSTGNLVILHRDSLNAIDTIETGMIGRVNGIVFANATTAYASTDTSGVAVIDLITNRVVFTIPFSVPLDGIAVAGNQIAVSMPTVSKVSIIDTRTNQVVSEIAMPTSWPTYVAADGVNNVFAVVCLGDGKVHLPYHSSILRHARFLRRST
jgi:DNA-binding beta-propeller fold protein YncE